MNYRISILAVFAIALLSFSFLPNRAHAMTFTPTRFEIRGDPGQTLTEDITVINENDDTETLYPSYANFEAQGESGTPAFITPTDDLGTWITTDPSLTLAPHEQKTVQFTVNIPKNADPGGHFAVIFFGTAAPNQKTGVSIGAKTGILVLLSVNGDVKQDAGLLSFNTTNNQFWFSTLPVTLEYRFRNDGGDRIKPVGTIRIHDTLYIPADKLDANPGGGNVLPSSTRKISVDWVKYEWPLDYTPPDGVWGNFWSNVSYQWKNFAIGLYSARLNVVYGVNNLRATKTTWFFVFPWQLVLVIAVTIFIVWVGGKKLIRKYNRYIIKKARAGMRGDTSAPSQSSHG